MWQAKKAREQAALKNAQSLFEELDAEKEKEESKRKAAARRRHKRKEKKKSKQTEKNNEVNIGIFGRFLGDMDRQSIRTVHALNYSNSSAYVHV